MMLSRCEKHINISVDVLHLLRPHDTFTRGALSAEPATLKVIDDGVAAV
jgi:hypothetical protein